MPTPVATGAITARAVASAQNANATAVFRRGLYGGDCASTNDGSQFNATPRRNDASSNVNTWSDKVKERCIEQRVHTGSSWFTDIPARVARKAVTAPVLQRAHTRGRDVLKTFCSWQRIPSSCSMIVPPNSTSETTVNDVGGPKTSSSETTDTA
jgi:hypothetical protein